MKRKSNKIAAEGGAPIANPDSVLDSELLAEAKSLRAQVRFGRGAARREWNKLKPTETVAGEAFTYSDDNINLESYTDKVQIVYNIDLSEQIKNTLKKIIFGAGKNEPLLLSASEIGCVQIPDEAKQYLLDKWMSDLASWNISAPESGDSRPSPHDHSEESHTKPHTNPQLPAEIPEEDKYGAWSRENGRGIVNFFEKGWPAPYIVAGILTRPEVFRLDKSAYTALSNHLRYLRAHRLEIPKSIDVPTRTDLVEEELRHVDRELMRTAARLRRAAQRRSQ